MNYKGVIIEESLESSYIPKGVKVVETKVEKVTEKHKTPWLKQWTLHTIEVPDAEGEKLAEKLSRTLEPNYWYIDYKNSDTHYIIFPKKVFRVNCKNQEEYKPVVSYGVSLNIPRYQLDFSPEIKSWERPEN